jgi:hypothetical protein
MIKGKKRSNLVYSTREARVHCELNIQSTTYSSARLFSVLQRKSEKGGSLTFVGNKYRYEPSKAYRDALANYHKTPVRRTN